MGDAYHCQIGQFELNISVDKARSPDRAAAYCARRWRETRDRFACESNEPAVIVDGVEYTPATYALPETEHIYDSAWAETPRR